MAINETNKKVEKESKFTFKKNLTGLDFINSLEGDELRGMKILVRMAANASQNPTELSYKDAVMLPMRDFQEFIKSFQEQSDLSKEDFLE